MRKMPNEPDRVGKKHLALRRQLRRANRRIKRRKHARRFQYFGLSKYIKQRGLSRIRVPNKRHRGHRNRFPPLPLLCPDTANIFNLLLHMPYAAENFSTVSFELSFARASSPNAAAKLRHLNAAPSQPRQHVFELRQLNLQLPFTSPSVTRKDVENELRAVDHSRIEYALDIALLRRRQIVIEKNYICRHRSGRAGNFLQLALTD